MKKLSKRLQDTVNKYPNKVFILFYFTCFLIVTAIIFLRFPNNFTHPNFYAEDGTIFISNLYKLGLFKSFLTPFNGYFIVGLYGLAGLGYLVNLILFHANFADLPRSISIVSYMFIGFSLTLPVLLFKKQLTFYWAFILVALSSFVPMRQSDYAILGTIGNLKWLFFYIAFLLIIYRYINFQKKWTQLILIDIGILVCAYTNSTTYLLIPIAFVPYAIEYIIRYKSSRKINLNFISSFWSLCVVAVLLIPQAVYVKMHGIPKITGYLDTPFNYSKISEIFIGRTYLYGFLYGVYQPLNDLKAIVLLLGVLTILYFAYKKRFRFIFWASLFATFCSSLLFVVNRPGISDFFFGYKNGGPDQFFFVQNLIIYFAITAAFFTRKISTFIKILILFLLTVFIVANLPIGSSTGRNNFMRENRGDIYYNLPLTCKTSNQDVSLHIYPSSGWDLVLPKTIICKGVSNE